MQKAPAWLAVKGQSSRGPNTITDNSAISACVKGAEWAKALALLTVLRNTSAEEECFSNHLPTGIGGTMTFVCSGQSYLICRAPDHVVGMGRHTALSGYESAGPVAPQAPTGRTDVKCLKLLCAAGFAENHVSGSCCFPVWRSNCLCPTGGNNN